MSCISLGIFSYNALSANGLCEQEQTIELFSDVLNIGSILYSDSGCTIEVSGGYYSDGTDVYEYQNFPVGISDIIPCSGLCTFVYCISNVDNFSDNYFSAGTHNGFSYFTGESTNNVIFYSTGETCWCVSTYLDGPCELFGKQFCSDICPDLCDSYFSEGYCYVTPTTTIPICDIVDFDAIFNCDIPESPTPTPSVTPTITPTPTPTPSNVCSSVNFIATGITYTPTPTPTPNNSPTPTPTPTNICFVDGTVTFNVVDDYIRCSNSKKFRDCFTGSIYYSTDLILINGEIPIEGYVYKMIVNSSSVCATFIGLVDNISGIDDIELVEEIGLEVDGSCVECVPSPSSTPSPSLTPTPTPTPTTPVECFDCSEVRNLPQPGNDIIVNGITISASGTGAIEAGILPFTPVWCIEGPTAGANWLSLGSNTLNPLSTSNPFSYTLTFSSPVNNVTLRIMGYEYVDSLTTEIFNFTTNTQDITINSCNYCCATINGGTLTAAKCPEYSPSGNYGGGIFTFSSSSSYTSLTITGNNVGQLNGALFDLCIGSIH